LPERVALADCVVVGKVTGFEPDRVSASPLLKIRNAPKVQFQIAIVTSESKILAAKDNGPLRVGFLPPAPPGSPTPQQYQKTEVKLRIDQQACFFLRRHPDESFYVAQTTFDVLDRVTTKTFDKDIALVGRCARLLADPDASLRSADAEDRWLTAAMRIYRYRTATVVYSGRAKTAPIDAEQSQRILAALAEGSWNEKDAMGPMGRLRLFLRLGLTRQDGWIKPVAVDATLTAARDWLRANGDSYRIRQYVPEDSGSGQ
jgi:hypothetical protein